MFTLPKAHAGWLGAVLFICSTAVFAIELPRWQVLEFEEQAFWATAHSRIEIPGPDAGDEYWKFSADSSVPGNSEQVSLRFDPATGQLLSRERLSKGKKDQRLKSFGYEQEFVLRERRSPEGKAATAPPEWPLDSRKQLSYPPAATELAVTNPYLLLLLADRLQAQGPGSTLEVLVHTDHNFYRARLTSGNGVPVEANYSLAGNGQTRGMRETTAVALRVTPEGELAEEDDFSLFGLSGEIIMLFDRHTGLPLQVRGNAPRIGATEINLKSATLRTPAT
tara:strand:+ start:6505 stop:7341 length:837 start_codon:yes stop_codon:yes gene_type:complete